MGTFLFCLLEAAFVGYVHTTTKTAPNETRLYAHPARNGVGGFEALCA